MNNKCHKKGLISTIDAYGRWKWHQTLINIRSHSIHRAYRALFCVLLSSKFFRCAFLPLFTPAMMMMMVMYDNETSRSAQPDICCLGAIFSSHSLYLLANAAVLLSTFLPSDYNSSHSHFKSSTEILPHTHIQRLSLTLTHR